MSYLLITYIVLVPISTFRESTLSIGVLSFSPSQILIGTLLSLSFMKLSMIKRRKIVSSDVRMLLVLLAFWGFESLIHLLWYSGRIYGYDYRRPLNYLEYMVVITVFVLNVRSRYELHRIIKAYMIIASVLMGLTLLKSLGVPIPGATRSSLIHIGPFVYGVAALFGKPEAYSAMALPIIPALLLSIFLQYPYRLSKNVGFVLVGLAIFCIALNGSRGTLVAISASLVISIYLLIQNGKRVGYSVRYFYYMLIAVVFIGIAFNAEYLSEFFLKWRSITIEQRLVGYRLGLELATESWYSFLFGAGKDLFVYEIEKISAMMAVPHNALLEELVADGLFGVGIMIFFFYKVLRPKQRHRTEDQRGVDSQGLKQYFLILASILSILCEGITANITPTGALWVNIALMASLYNINNSEISYGVMHRVGYHKSDREHP